MDFKHFEKERGKDSNEKLLKEEGRVTVKNESLQTNIKYISCVVCTNISRTKNV